MHKLEITDVQIDNYNETVDKLNKFDSGLNVICGANEIGKSTLMSFIKNIFVREKTDAKGYIKCNLDGNEIKLYANKNKLKENENYIEKITAHSFKTGFVINLDDLIQAKKSDSDELVNTIKDSSGNAVNTKENDLKDFIYGKKQNYSLTIKNNKPSKTFEQQFNKLREIDNKIKELQSQEEEYNTACIQLEIVDEEIKSLRKQLDYSTTILEQQTIKNDSEKITLNQILLDNKQKLESIRESFGALNALNKNEDDYKNKLEENKTKYDEILDKINRIEQFDDNKIDRFETNPENLKTAKQLIEQNKKLHNEVEYITKEISNHSEKLNSIDINIQNTKKDLDSIGISNFENYTNDKLLLENHIANYCKLSDDIRRSGETINGKQDFDYNKFFILIFAGILCACIGALILYFHENIRYILIALILVSVCGINTAIMQKSAKKSTLNESYLKGLRTSKIAITALSKTYKLRECSDNDFVVNANCNLDTMKELISEYKRISAEITKYENEKIKEETEIEKYKGKLTNLQKDIDIINNEINEFLKSVSISDINNFPEIYDYVREAQILKNKEKEYKNEIDKISKLTENFVQETNSFIEICSLTDIKTLNKYDVNSFETTLKTIQEIYDKNLTDCRLKEEYSERIKKLELELNNFDKEITETKSNMSEEFIQNLDKHYQEKKEERTLLKDNIEKLSKVESLVELKNKKNVELINLRNALNNLMAKEIVYKIIQNSKEKFNEIQPNLISAEQYLSKITNNKYTKIDFENRTISGENIKEKDWDLLSRGTKEQLYLALRLGYANNYSKDREGNPNDLPNLPLIIDDAFVNFDTERTKAVLKCLEEFSKTNQVLFFTCHTKSITEILNNEKIKHKMINL